ncbi:glyceraldehyde-3-phosphate ferredoxin oxidoreductase [Ignicoccus hospitalis KIN4/I]|uniref:Glyceraldehyde-3-phosphate ferredoxin oxidoreductase n=1 Tax=Ignicoccus hospitalis (strain KIN4/I / DSM 18386 / JCM 14125) TaxID=453591 RepID=A8A977_IGNH4|nr:glyceraldehyde-3-phosphate ferredoxin oxidoreductase [Ignicoccus hospitalis KIN4/I]
MNAPTLWFPFLELSRANGLREPLINPIEIDLEEENWRRININALGPVEAGVKLHLKYQTQDWDPVEKNLVVMGTGPFARSPFFGSNRLIIVFKSPMTRGLHVTAAGGAGFDFISSGTSLVVFKGRANSPKIVLLEGDEEGLKDVKFKNVTSDAFNYGGYFGTFALSKYVYDNYSPARAVAVGPFSLFSVSGSLVSIERLGNELSPFAVDFFGRGGPGSALARAHNVWAVGFGGRYEPPEVPGDLPERLSREAFGKSYVEAVLEATTKYRYDPKYKSGGTFGVNYVYYRDLIPMFAFNSIYYSDETRTRLSKMIIKYFWTPFVEETIKRRVFGGCGDPCPAACKKVWRGVKLDYEPSNAMGPLIGVFKLDLTVKLIEVVDSYGMDAIEAGHVVSWLMDALYRNLLRPEELGVSEPPSFDPSHFEVEESEKNYEIAKKILEQYAKGVGVPGEAAKRGLRGAAKYLDRELPSRTERVKFEDLAVYVAFGEKGYMTPNLYWAPGMVAPLYVLGRYWTNYRPTFDEPEKFAESSFKRALKELIIDNAGICRFHRKWAERLVGEMYKEMVGAEVNDEYAKAVYRSVAVYNVEAGAEPVPWESKKTYDVVRTMAKRVMPEKWGRLFDEGKGIEWWARFKARVEELLEIRPPRREGGVKP